jgi:nicotinamide-nucleotide amidase
MIHDPRRAAAVAVGNELVEGRTLDSNSGEIAARLAELGITVAKFVVVGDDAASLERTFRELCSEYALVIATGGLGPTLDDVTREAAATAAGVELALHDEAIEGLRELYRQRGRPMPKANERQAWFPAGAQIMKNACGTAPGFRVWIEGGVLAALPGPPREMRDMLERELLPWIRATCGQGPSTAIAHFYLAGLAESQFADDAGAWMERGADPRLDVTAHHGVLHATMRVESASRAAAAARLAAARAQFRERFREWIFSEDEPRLAHVVVRELIARKITISLAESCTGGAIARELTEVAGISAVFREAWVTYSNESKIARLGVPRDAIERHGAVSSEVAALMARGAARESGAEIALSVTGVAGPDGGTPEKPVGLVWFGLAHGGGVRTLERRFPQIGRDAIRLYATHTALEILWRAIRPA